MTEAFETITLQVANKVALVTLNRPDRRNALNMTLLADLNAAFVQIAGDDAVRAVVVTGAGQGFCAGADLSDFQQTPTGEQVYQKIIENYLPLMNRIVTLPKPVITAVNGAAAGAGASLALAGDLRIMGESAYMMMAFSNIGLVPDGGACWFMIREMGYARAYQMAVEGGKISAKQCVAWGLANKVVTDDALLDEAIGWAESLAKRPTLALGLTKQALNHAAMNPLASTIEFEARLQKQTIPSHDHMEGVMAFIQRREPDFQGK